MASVGLSLGRLFHTLFIASGGRAFGDLRRAATGSHPGLDPLWSTETPEFVHSGVEATKADKIAVLASSPLALQVLRVCWENPGGAYNCGRCPKCLATMVALDLHGVLSLTGQLPHKFNPTDIAGLDFTVGYGMTRWFDILARAKAMGDRPELVEAIETALARGAWAASRLGRLEGSVGRYLAQAGLRPARIKALDHAVLGGLVTRLFRAGRRSLSMARVGRRE